MKFSELRGQGATITNNLVVKGNVYFIGPDLATSLFFPHDPTDPARLIDPAVLDQEVPSSAVNIIAGTPPAKFDSADGCVWKAENVIDITKLYISGQFYMMAPSRTSDEPWFESNGSLRQDADTRLPGQGHVDETQTPGVLKNATDRAVTELPVKQ